MKIRIAESLEHYNKNHKEKLTPRELAKEVIERDISDTTKEQYLASYNQGTRNIRPGELSRLSEKLEVSTDYLLYKTEKP